MSNEVVFFSTAILDLLFVLLAWRLGKAWVYITIVVNILLVSTFAAKLVPIFGMVTNAANAFYAAIFIATDILTEHHGKRVGYRSIWMGFLGLVMFVGLGQLVLLFSTIDASAPVSEAMHTLFSAVPRIAAASFIAYLIAQTFDVWFYHWIHHKTGPKHLWLRNNLSTMTSQLIDSLIFFTLAFWGTVPFSVLMNIIWSGYLVKVIVAVMDTPFIYLSYTVIGKSPPRATDRASIAIVQEPRADTD